MQASFLFILYNTHSNNLEEKNWKKLFTKGKNCDIIILQTIFIVYIGENPRKENTMKKSSILKFILTVGIVISAVLAVVAVIARMQRKLREVDGGDDDGENTCGGNCSDCSLCDEDDGESDDDTEEVTE